MEEKHNIDINSYELSRKWFNFCFDNPELIKPIHTAIYFFAIEHCNRLGWKKKFGFPSNMVMEAIGVKNWRTYSKALNEIVEIGFIEMIEKSKNQYSSNIIAIVKNTKASTKALDKALSKHSQKQGTKQGQSTVSINKQETNNKEQLNNKQAMMESFESWWELYEKKGNKKKSLEKWLKLNQDQRDKCFHVVSDYVKSTPNKQYRKNGETYLNQEAWNDEIITPTNNQQPKMKNGFSDADYKPGVM